MKKAEIMPVIFSFVLLIALLIIPTGFEGALSYQNAERVRVRVFDTDESSIVDTGLIRTGEQRCLVEILEGKFKDEKTSAINRLNGSLAQDKIFTYGDVAFAAVSYADNKITTVTMTDHYRLDKEVILGGECEKKSVKMIPSMIE